VSEVVEVVEVAEEDLEMSILLELDLTKQFLQSLSF
jgi:hypothetical protein